MVQQDVNFNHFYEHIFTKSLFTERQISIIYKRVTNQSKLGNISSGAYYRQVKQCRQKINGMLYSILLLRLIGAIDNRALFAIEQVISQINVILNSGSAGDIKEGHTQNVMSLVDKLINTICKV